MSSLRSFIAVALIATGFSGVNANAQESENLQQLRHNVIAACPKRWENMSEYLSLTSSYANSRLQYTEAMKEQGVDIWQGDLADRQNYIKFALINLVDDTGAPLQSFTHPVSVVYQCFKSREQYLVEMRQEMYSTTSAFYARFDEFRDSDNDGVFNSFDLLCSNTQAPPADTADVISVDGYQIYDTNTGLLAVDAQGCAAWERDDDGDLVPDYFDHCPAELGATTTSDGCADADSDGVSNGKDSYPYQDDTICVIE